MATKHKDLVYVRKRIRTISHDVQSLLMQMGMSYAADPERHDVAYWVGELGEGKVDLTSASWWASVHEWDALRQRFWRDMENRFLRGAVAKLANQRLREIDRLDRVSNMLYSWLLPESDGKTFRVQPRSYEGVAMALKVIDEHLTSKRQELVGQLGDRPGLPVGHIPSFSAEQVAALARAALDMRRAQLDAERRTVDVEAVAPAAIPAATTAPNGDGPTSIPPKNGTSAA